MRAVEFSNGQYGMHRLAEHRRARVPKSQNHFLFLKWV
jgi:hypothetical protein